jgi:hypothetical protein
LPASPRSDRTMISWTQPCGIVVIRFGKPSSSSRFYSPSSCARRSQDQVRIPGRAAAVPPRDRPTRYRGDWYAASSHAGPPPQRRVGSDFSLFRSPDKRGQWPAFPGSAPYRQRRPDREFL